MSLNGYLTDATTRHQVFIQRFAGGQVRNVMPIFDAAAKEMMRVIRKGLAEPEQIAAAPLVLREIQDIATAAGLRIKNKVEPDLSEFAEYEAGYQSRLMGGAVSVQLTGVTTQAVSNALLSSSLILNGKAVTFSDMFETLASSMSRETITAVQGGITAGLTNSQITDSVSSLLDNRTRSQVEAVVRTAANHAGHVGRQAFNNENSRVIKREVWRATLDSRTRPEHAAMDGRTYPLGIGPTPPLGYNCRCIRVPVVADEFAVLREGSTRSSIDGPVDSKTTYNSFLKRQSKDFQNEVLGKDRADLFRGGMNVSKFADDTGKLLTLNELSLMEGLTL